MSSRKRGLMTPRTLAPTTSLPRWMGRNTRSVSYVRRCAGPAKLEMSICRMLGNESPLSKTARNCGCRWTSRRGRKFLGWRIVVTKGNSDMTPSLPIRDSRKLRSSRPTLPLSCPTSSPTLPTASMAARSLPCRKRRRVRNLVQSPLKILSLVRLQAVSRKATRPSR